MSDNLTLEDGRTWWASTINVANVLYEIGITIEGRNVEFAAWLKDKSDRPAPFMHFDLRGLSQECLELFYNGALESYSRLSAEHGEEWVNSSFGTAFSRLIEMHKHINSGGIPEEFTDLEVVPNYDGEPISFSELWSNT